MIRSFALTLIVLLAPAFASAQATSGIALFEQRCATCHNNRTPENRAPDRVALSQRTPEQILEALTTGVMVANAAGLTDAQKRILAEQLALRPLGASSAGAVSAMSNRCAPASMRDSTEGPRWSGWGADSANTRFQSAQAAGLAATDVPKLKLKWAFGFPNSTSGFSQPAVVGGRLFVGSDNGFVYALDAKSGCAYWSYQAQAGVRTAVSVGPIAGNPSARTAIYFGDLKGNVYAVNADSGDLVWTKRADPHPLTRITGAPTLDAGVLYVPLSSLEEAAGSTPTYECCTFRGGVVAYDASTGREIWRTYAIPDTPKRLKKNSVGTQLWGPAGAAIWSSPTVDVKRGLVYVATGNAYDDPAAEMSDALLALDLKTGTLRWSKQVMPRDTYVIGCSPNDKVRDNCPEETGPDFDFGNSPILRTLPNGKSILTLGQKSGVAWGLDPDREGAIVWQRRVGKGSALGGMEWGSAADERLAYFPVADAQFGPAEAGGLYALRLESGAEVWHWRPTNDCAPGQRNCLQAMSAAISVIPGVVFGGAITGMFRAFSADDGRVLWEFNTARAFDTVNGVAAKGGSLNGPGPVIVDGMLYTNSGYAYLGTGIAGNVLLAFAPEP
ncbi:MAG: PQQ-binding-like beta-propeller repeat protein [Acidobacteriaceae bacterium]|jgi:polyvinyl alcohol dehydrogenase (cytochrome)|nr:PQQ-binding-like beta-propeller repeat protein [Acidobacteriaceae bacterium]